MTCQDKESLDESVIGWGEPQITNDDRRQNTDPEAGQVECTCYTDPKVNSNDGRCQNTKPEDGQVEYTCYTVPQVNKHLIKLCKCQRTEDRGGMTCQNKESLDEGNWILLYRL